MIVAGLLCGSALSQLPGSTDRPGKSPRTPPPPKPKDDCHEQKNQPTPARVKSKKCAEQAKQPRGPKAEPSPLESVTLPPEPSATLPRDTQAGVNSNEAQRATVEAEPTPTPTPTDAANTPATWPLEVKRDDLSTGAAPTASGSPGLNVVNFLDTPEEGKTETKSPASFPEFKVGELDSPLFKVVPEVNPLSAILDSEKVFVETVKNRRAHGKILNELRNYPKLKVVATREEADFVVSYTDKHGLDIVSGGTTASGKPGIPMPVPKLLGEMVVYKIVPKQGDGPDKREVVWSEPEDRERFIVIPMGRHPATNLTRQFIKALRRLRGEIK